MPFIDERLIDPAPDALKKLCLKGMKSANGRLRRRKVEKDDAFFTSFIKRVRKKPEGSQRWVGATGYAIGAAKLKVAWWTDFLGRKHWRVLAGRVEWTDEQLKHSPFAGYGLWHVYPQRVLLVRQGTNPDEVRVLCACGAAGTPRSIAWTGLSCGPCNDRREEGGPPLYERPVPVVLRGHTQPVARLVFAGPNWLISGGYDGRVIAWNLQNETHQVILNRPRGTVYGLAASASGVVAVSTAANRFMLRDLTQNHDWVTVSLRIGHPIVMQVSPDGKWVLVGGWGACYLVEVADPLSRQIPIFTNLSSTDPGSIIPMSPCFATFSPDGRFVYASDSSGRLMQASVPEGHTSVLRPGDVTLDVDDYDLMGDDLGGGRILTCSPDGKSLAAGGTWNQERGPIVYDSVQQTWTSLKPAEGQAVTVLLSYAADGALASYDTDAVLRLWDVAKGACRGGLYLDSRGVGVFSPDGANFAHADATGTVHIWPWRSVLESR